MSDTTEIPADVLALAEAHISRFGCHDPIGSRTRMVASAIMAERARCAQIVGGVGLVLRNNGVPLAGDLLQTLSDAIENPDAPSS